MKYLKLKATTFLIAATLASPLAAQEAGGRLDIVVQPEPPGLMLGLVQNLSLIHISEPTRPY